LQDSISKLTRVKCTGGVAQAVKCLLYKGEALSSNFSPTKTNKAKRTKNESVWEFPNDLGWGFSMHSPCYSDEVRNTWILP
jgi:hypothetical protein